MNAGWAGLWTGKRSSATEPSCPNHHCASKAGNKNKVYISLHNGTAPSSSVYEHFESPWGAPKNNPKAYTVSTLILDELINMTVQRSKTKLKESIITSCITGNWLAYLLCFHANISHTATFRYLGECLTHLIIGTVCLRFLLLGLLWWQSVQQYRGLGLESHPCCSPPGAHTGRGAVLPVPGPEKEPRPRVHLPNKTQHITDTFNNDIKVVL